MEKRGVRRFALRYFRTHLVHFSLLNTFCSRTLWSTSFVVAGPYFMSSPHFVPEEYFKKAEQTFPSQQQYRLYMTENGFN